MKPDWKDAPEWASWLGHDEQGKWWWFENCPEWKGTTGTSGHAFFEHRGRSQPASFWAGYYEAKP
jgi:hypothetical protein